MALVAGARVSAVAGSVVGPSDDDRAPPSWLRRWADVEPIFGRAVGRGDLPADVDADALFAACAGTLYFRAQVIGRRVDDDWITRMLAVCLPNERVAYPNVRIGFVPSQSRATLRMWAKVLPLGPEMSEISMTVPGTCSWAR